MNERVLAMVEDGVGPQAAPLLQVAPDWSRAGTTVTAVPATIAGPVPAPSKTVADQLRALLAEVWGHDFEAADDQTTFVELGFESLALMQVTLAIAKRFGVTVAFRELLGDLDTITALAAHLEHTIPQPVPPVAGPVAAPAAATAPLTEAQREIWLATMLTAAESCVFNQSRTLRLRGPLRRDALATALRQLVQRHDALRTTFAGEGDVQTVVPHADLALVVHDFSAEEPARREARLQDLLAADAAQPFDLTCAPLLRAQLVKLDTLEHVLVFTAQHVICDGKSLAVLFHELGELYSAGCRGVPATLPPVRSLLAYAQDELALAAGPARQAAEAYWLRQFAAEPPALAWPADFPRPAAPSYRGTLVRLELEPALAQQLRQASARQGCTLFTFLLAAYYLFLHRLTGQTDLVVGAPVASPCAGGPGALVGHTVNFLALRLVVADQTRWNAHVQQVKQVFLDAYDHRQLTYGSLLTKLKLGRRDRSRLPLVSAAFNLAQVRHTQEYCDLGVEVRENPHRFTNLDLMFDFSDSGGGLELECVYNVDLFAPATIERWLQHFRTVLAAVVAQPGGRLATVPLLTASERRQLLVEWNATTREYPGADCLHRLFEAQVARTPHAVAVVCEGRQLTYGELNQRANQLAHTLRGLGVGPDQFVGICLERSLEMVVGLLGVLKAGAAYVPIAPDYPQDRVAFMLADAAAPVLLTQRALVAALPAHTARVLCLDEAGPVAAVENLPAGAGPDNLAYMIYTSGSTGQPKGAMISHRAIVNHMQWMQATFPLDARDAVLQKTPFSFDPSVWEYYAPLLVGGRLVVARPGGHLDPAYLAQVIRAQGVTILRVVPSLLRMLVDEPAFAACHGLRRMLCGGEELTSELARRFCALLPAELHNFYGPTEVTIVSVFYTVPRADVPSPVPIGRPVANTRAYVLDGHGQPVPIGVQGELYLGGVQVARSYHRRPELTAARFLADSFGPPGERMYRTGDRVRYRPDGTLEFLGRLDHQVKIRGQRIELGEIEAVLRELPEVRAAVAIVREDTPGDQRLVAYLLVWDGAVPVADLRRRVSAKLPEYMVPGAFVTLDQFPLTPNGKVDRKALPAPERAVVAAAAGYVAPHTLVEKRLAAIWSEVLRVKPIGVHDNFFELGGHSLLAMQVSSRVRAAFGVALPLPKLFENPTVSQLAGQLETLLWAQPAGPMWAGRLPAGIVEGAL